MRELLNKQIEMEYQASTYYLHMGNWMANNGYSGTAKFLYSKASEERDHMMKIVDYVNDFLGLSIIPGTEKPLNSFNNYLSVFEFALEAEESVTKSICNIAKESANIGDYKTLNFIQWFITEQLEEEKQMMDIIEQIKMGNEDPVILYHIDRELGNLVVTKKGVE